jgi:hypothetical protein
MVKALHRAAIEVILDVVFNHTAEGDHRGPTLSLRVLPCCPDQRVNDLLFVTRPAVGQSVRHGSHRLG